MGHSISIATLFMLVLLAAACGRREGETEISRGIGTSMEAETGFPSLNHDLPADTAEFRRRRLRLVGQLAAQGIADGRVLDALRQVPRHRFVPDAYASRAYENRPLPIGYGQTISQPFVVAYMTELVRPAASDRVLEIGTGSGYQAAVLGELVREVYTVEIIPELARTARLRLGELGYRNVHVRQADGFFGWEEHAPFDAIVVTAAAEHIPPPLIEQLKDGGRMIIPVGSPFRTQMLMLVEKRGEEFSTRSLIPVAFVPFTRAGK
jgi:protein-L-isoaspartate(D-aspartate) O-methyltransferase